MIKYYTILHTEITEYYQNNPAVTFKYDGARLYYAIPLRNSAFRKDNIVDGLLRTLLEYRTGDTLHGSEVIMEQSLISSDVATGLKRVFHSGLIREYAVYQETLPLYKIKLSDPYANRFKRILNTNSAIGEMQKQELERRGEFLNKDKCLVTDFTVYNNEYKVHGISKNTKAILDKIERVANGTRETLLDGYMINVFNEDGNIVAKRGLTWVPILERKERDEWKKLMI